MNPTSSPVFRSATITAMLLLPLAADEVMLADESRLSGTVTALADSGFVVLESDLSFSPFKIRSEQLRRVNFNQAQDSSDQHDCMITLANGDTLPGDLVGLDHDSLTVTTSFAGEIRIPRSAVSTVQFGVRPRKTLYQGPSSDDQWTIKGGWSYRSQGFHSEGTGTLGRELAITGSYSLKFRLSWRQLPNLQVHFSSATLDASQVAERYLLQFSSGGFDLRRQTASSQTPLLAMASIARDPTSFDRNSVEIELLVDRELGRVHLLLNGAEAGVFKDPVSVSPSGKGILFRSLVGGPESLSITGIEVRDWNASAVRHGKEERGDSTRDVVITRQSDRGTGEILSLSASTGSSPTLRFKGPHHPDPVDLPLDQISTLFFTRKESDAPSSEASALKLSLGRRGLVGVTDFALDGGKIHARHPLLGELTIQRDSVASLQREAPSESAAESP